MKLLIIMLILTSSMFARELKPVDKTHPEYQLDWGIMPPGNCWFGGGWSERQDTRELSASDRAAIEATAVAAMYRKAAYAAWVLTGLACIGAYLMKAREGIGVAIICALFSFASSFMAQTVHLGLRIGLCTLAVAAVALCYHPSVRDWSVSHSSLYKKIFGGKYGKG